MATQDPKPAAKTPAAKKPAAAKAAQTYKVLSRLEHDGEAYGPGTENTHIELGPAHAKPLLEVQVIARDGDGDEPVDPAEG